MYSINLKNSSNNKFNFFSIPTNVIFLLVVVSLLYFTREDDKKHTTKKVTEKEIHMYPLML